MYRIILLLTLLFASCGQPITNEEETRLQNSIINLNKLETDARNKLDKTERYLEKRYQESKNVDRLIAENKKILNILEKGRRPVYILKLKFQEHKMELTFDRISFEFEVPVDEKFYHEAQVGEKLAEGSRWFNLFHSGDIEVVSKRIQ